MTATPVSPPPRAGSSPTPAEVRTMRRLLLVAAVVYFAWWFVVETVLPGAFNPLLGRLGVVSAFLVTLAASFISRAAWRPLRAAFVGCAWLLTAHYYYLFHGNHGDMPWAVGAY